MTGDREVYSGELEPYRVPIFGLLLLAMTLAVGGCSRIRKPMEPDLASYQWPPGDPKVRLVEVLDGSSGTRRGFLSRWAGLRKSKQLFRRPFGIAWAGSDLLIADPGAGRVFLLTGDGQIRRSAANLFESPIGVAACGGKLFVSDSKTGKIARLSRQLRVEEWIAEDLQRPTGLACGPRGVFIAETARHRIVIIRPDASRGTVGRRGEKMGEFNYPTTLSLKGDFLWVGDTLNFRVQRIDLSTQTASKAFGKLGDSPGEMPRIKGIAVDSVGRLWISDGYLDQVSIYDENGNFLLSMGRRGAGPAEFTFPAGIAANPDGRIAIADSLNGRIQIFQNLSSNVGGDK